MDVEYSAGQQTVLRFCIQGLVVHAVRLEDVLWEHLASFSEELLRQVAEQLLEAIGLHQHALSHHHRALCTAEGLVPPRPCMQLRFPPVTGVEMVPNCQAPAPLSVCVGAGTVPARKVARRSGWCGACQLHQSCGDFPGALRDRLKYAPLSH